MTIIDCRNQELITMAELEPKEVHAQRIADKKQANLARAKAHYSDKIHNQPGTPAEKVKHRLTTNKPKE
jgi:hypothetical protein